MVEWGNVIQTTEKTFARLMVEMKTNYFKKKNKIMGQGITLARAWFGKVSHPIPLAYPKKPNTRHPRKPVLNKLVAKRGEADD